MRREDYILKRGRYIVALALAFMLLLGAAFTFDSSTANAAPNIPTHYCPNHNKKLVYKGEHSTTKCSSCKKSCTIVTYKCPTKNCMYEEYRCNKCGAIW